MYGFSTFYDDKHVRKMGMGVEVMISLSCSRSLSLSCKGSTNRSQSFRTFHPLRHMSECFQSYGSSEASKSSSCSFDYVVIDNPNMNSSS